MKPTKSEKLWNIVSMFVFLIVFSGVAYIFHIKSIDIRDIGIFDFAVISLATYRMTRLVVYDRLLKLFRDIIKSLSGTGFGDSLKSIITCPWCAGVWISLFNVFIFFVVPYGNMFLYIMAIAGIATFLQLLVNITGLTAEGKQIDVKKKRKPED